MPGAGEDARGWTVRRSESGQVYWYIGYALALMAQMNLLTGERKWIDAAEKLLVFVKTCHPQIFESTSNAKIAWGCAEIFSVTGDAGFRDTSARMAEWRSEEHTSELQSLMRTSYAVFCLKKKIR